MHFRLFSNVLVKSEKLNSDNNLLKQLSRFCFMFFYLLNLAELQEIFNVKVLLPAPILLVERIISKYVTN